MIQHMTLITGRKFVLMRSLNKVQNRISS